MGCADVLVNNAGMSPLYPSLVDCRRGPVRQGPGGQPQGLVPAGYTLVGARMAAGDGGSIINVSSVAAIRPTPNELPLRSRQGRPRRAHRRFRSGLRAGSASEHDHVRAVLHRHRQGVGPRRRREDVRRLPSASGAANPARSWARPSTWPAPLRASPPARSSAPTVARPSPTDRSGRASSGGLRVRAVASRRGLGGEAEDVFRR